MDDLFKIVEAVTDKAKAEQLDRERQEQQKTELVNWIATHPPKNKREAA